MSEREPYLEKHAAWDEKMRQLDRVVDALDQQMDPDIKESVAALNLLGYETNSSCAGHVEPDRQGFPYIQVQPAGEPQIQYAGEMEERARISQKYGIAPGDINREVNLDADEEWESFKEKIDFKRTEEYQAWLQQAASVEKDVARLLEEFAIVHPHNITTWKALGSTRITDKDDVKKMKKDFPSEKIYLQKIRNSQNDFVAFTTFLKQRYFNS